MPYAGEFDPAHAGYHGRRQLGRPEGPDPGRGSHPHDQLWAQQRGSGPDHESYLRTACLEKAVNSVLNLIPTWHLDVDADKPPTFEGHVTGTLDEAPNGALKTASLSVTVSADADATIEGYFGNTFLHVGVGVTAELEGEVAATASYSTSHGWTFGGSVTVTGSLKGFAEETVLAWQGELYAKEA